MLSIHITVKLLVYICFVSLTLWDVLKRLPHHLPSMQQQQSKTGNNTIRGEYDGDAAIFTDPIKEVDFAINKTQRKYNSKICHFLDFSVTGFAKCGTTSMRTWLSAHNDTRMAPVRKEHDMTCKLVLQ